MLPPGTENRKHSLAAFSISYSKFVFILSIFMCSVYSQGISQASVRLSRFRKTVLSRVVEQLDVPKTMQEVQGRGLCLQVC